MTHDNTAESRAADEAEKDYLRAAFDVAADGAVRVTSLVARRRRAEDAANYDRVVAARPLKPPPHRFTENTVGPGELEARQFNRREAWTYVTYDMLTSPVPFARMPHEHGAQPQPLTITSGKMSAIKTSGKRSSQK